MVFVILAILVIALIVGALISCAPTTIAAVAGGLRARVRPHGRGGGGDRRAAETELQERRERRAGFDIVPLSRRPAPVTSRPGAATQAQFVDEPAEAPREADRLITSVMRDRGYPVATTSSSGPPTSRSTIPRWSTTTGPPTPSRGQPTAGEASTEDLRQALVHYRSLFDELLGTDGFGTAPPRDPRLSRRSADGGLTRTEHARSPRRRQPGPTSRRPTTTSTAGTAPRRAAERAGTTDAGARLATEDRVAPTNARALLPAEDRG